MSTGATSSPPRTVRWRRSAGGIPRVSTAPSARSTSDAWATARPSTLAGARAPVSARVSRPRPHRQAAEQHLERGAVGQVADQPGAQPVGRAVGGAGAADTDRRQTGSALVLHEREGPGGEHLAGPVSGPADVDVAHGRARCEQRRRVPGDVPEGEGRRADRLPAAGRGPRVDPGELAGQSDGAGGDGRGWSRRGTRSTGRRRRGRSRGRSRRTTSPRGRGAAETTSLVVPVRRATSPRSPS